MDGWMDGWMKTELITTVDNVDGNLCHVRYIVDGHAEKLIPITRMTMIPMPFRREKAKLRTRSLRTTTDTMTGMNCNNINTNDIKFTILFLFYTTKRCEETKELPRLGQRYVVHAQRHRKFPIWIEA
jgi:hypothetical protein